MSERLESRARELLEGEFMRQAAEPGAEQRIDDELSEKLSSIGDSERGSKSRIRKLAGQAAAMWADRGKLERKHMIYLGAALLYFISPIDAVPDVLPALGYLDDIAVLSAVLTALMGAIESARGKVVDEVTDKLVSKGRVALDEVVEQRSEELFERFDRSASIAVDNSVTTLVISLWGMTTAAAISLGLGAVFGGFTAPWVIYVGLTAALVVIWNLGVALDYLRGYRELDGAWQARLRTLIVAKLSLRHLLAIALPAGLLVGLGVFRMLSA